VPLPPAWRSSSFARLAFSPDGRRIAFSRTWGDGRAGTLRNEVDDVGLDGRGPRTLYRNPIPFSAQPGPAFSPDGSTVALRVGEPPRIVAVRSTGGAARELTTPGGIANDGDPLFSPDGGWIAFARNPARGVSDVYVVRPDGTGLRRLTTTPIPPSPQPHVGSSPLAWSPDSSRLLTFRFDRFAVVDVASRTSTDLRRVGVQYAVTSARWAG
jgi:Tol biopolymer transport system component